MQQDNTTIAEKKNINKQPSQTSYMNTTNHQSNEHKPKQQQPSEIIDNNQHQHSFINQSEAGDGIQKQSNVGEDNIDIMIKQDKDKIRLGKIKFQLMKDTKNLFVQTIKMRNQMLGVRYVDRVEGSVFDGKRWEQMRIKYYQKRGISATTATSNQHTTQIKKPTINLADQQQRLAAYQHHYNQQLRQQQQDDNDFYYY